MKDDRGIRANSFFTILVLLLFPASLLSQQSVATADDLVAHSEVIAIGKVTNLASEWNEAHTRIRTRVTLNVDEYVKGSSSTNSLTIYVPGGEVDGVGEIYSHTPSFKENESVVVFARKDTQDRFRISEGSQGKFTIEDATSSRPKMVGGVSLDQFRTQIKLAVQRQQEMKR